MLGSIRKFFGKKNTSVKHSGTPDEHDHLERENPSFVTDHHKIIHLLEQLIIEPPRCTVTIDNSDSLFITEILGIDPDVIRFSSLSPSDGNQLVILQGTLKLSTALSGIPLTFNLHDISVDQVANPPCFKAPIPEKLYYPQRRLSKRMSTNSSAIEFKGVSRDTGAIVQGYVTDISRGGLSVIYNSSRSNIMRSDHLNNCTVLLPENQTIAFELTVSANKKPILGSSKRHLGGQFENLYPQDEKKLDRYLSTLERQQLRKRQD